MWHFLSADGALSNCLGQELTLDSDDDESIYFSVVNLAVGGSTGSYYAPCNQ